jgi:hypothetical protein
MKILAKNISSTALTRAENDINSQQFDNNFERLNLGIDVNGKKIKNLGIRYTRWKKDYIKGRLNHREKTLKTKKKWFRELYTTTEMKANSTPNYGRLTGKTFSNVIYESTVRILKDRIKITVWTYIKKKQQNLIAQGLIEKYKRYYYGGLASQTSKRGQNELQKIMDIVSKRLNLKKL